ncbi:MAG: RNB domain-containing ribonuclease, partial [Gammaproteobacteria bacterium]|nr:RNB domain-containing ribonuclease [Gammaproteobacteria bacterium]
MSNTTPEQDPYASREAEKYENPVPSREFITMLLEKKGKPMTFKAVAKALQIEDEDQLEGLRRRLRAMERDGQLHFNRRGGYGLLSKMNLVRGRVIGHADGFGFLVPDEGDNDIFLSAKTMRSCLHGDRIIAHITGVDRRGRSEGAVTEILEHANHHISGRFHLDGEIGFFEADNKRISQDILIPESERGEAKDGQLVVVEITEYPTNHHQAQGRVIEILGDHMAPGMEIDMALRSHDIPYDWSPLVVDEAAQLSDVVSEADATEAGRTDLRDMPLVTIDGDDSMDFDDAVYAEKSGDGWRLVVAIAD